MLVGDLKVTIISCQDCPELARLTTELMQAREDADRLRAGEAAAGKEIEQLQKRVKDLLWMAGVAESVVGNYHDPESTITDINNAIGELEDALREVTP